jgi:hypothetical protein
MKVVISLLITSFVLLSCKKEKRTLFKSEGVITGVDVRQCPCVVTCPCICGGLLFHFTDTTYTANVPLDNPGILNLPSEIKFPVYLQLNWENTSRCGITAIKITSYKIL